MSVLQKKHDNLLRDVLNRIHDLEVVLDGVKRRLAKDTSNLNDLGELQSVPMMLDARIGALAVISRMLEDEKQVSLDNAGTIP